MADRIVRVYLTGTVIRALRDLGIIKHETRNCRRHSCDQMFVPSDGRQEFCSEQCGKAVRQKAWRKHKATQARQTAYQSRYARLNLPPDAIVADAPIGKRAKMIALNAHLRTVADVRVKSDADLLKIRGLGRLVLADLRRL